MPGGEFIGPAQYQWYWGLIGVLLIALVVAWWVFVLVSTRRGRVAAPATPGPPSEAAVDAIRRRYLGLIDETRAAYATGELDERDAFHQLSMLMRAYVEEREGTRTVTLTLRELRERELTPLSEAVARLYPGAFAPSSRGTVARAIDDARGLVTSWKR